MDSVNSAVLQVGLLKAEEVSEQSGEQRLSTCGCFAMSIFDMNMRWLISSNQAKTNPGTRGGGRGGEMFDRMPDEDVEVVGVKDGVGVVEVVEEVIEEAEVGPLIERRACEAQSPVVNV